MRYEILVGLRYLKNQRRRAFLSTITTASVLGVMLGVAALTLVLSVVGGFEDELKRRILGTNAHVLVLRYGGEFQGYDGTAREIATVPGVAGASPFIFSEIMLTRKGERRGTVVKGIDPNTAALVSDIGDHVIEGTMAALGNPEFIKPSAETLEHYKDEGEPPVVPGIVIGEAMAKSIRASVGDELFLVNPLGDNPGAVALAIQPKSKVFRVAGIFRVGYYDYDAKLVFIHLPDAQEFFKMPGAVTGLEVKTTDIDKAPEIARAILSKLQGYPFRTRDWRQMNHNLFAAIAMQKVVMFIILVFIVIVAAFNIVSTLYLFTAEKTKEVAILKSLGATGGQVMRIFQFIGGVIGLAGTGAGVLLGLGLGKIAGMLDYQLDPQVYFIDHLPVRMNPIEFAMVATVALLLCSIATLPPSLFARRMHPVDGLRLG